MFLNFKELIQEGFEIAKHTHPDPGTIDTSDVLRWLDRATGMYKAAFGIMVLVEGCRSDAQSATKTLLPLRTRRHREGDARETVDLISNYLLLEDQREPFKYYPLAWGLPVFHSPASQLVSAAQSRDQAGTRRETIPRDGLRRGTSL